MKKFYTLFAAVLVGGSLQAQQPFFTATSYHGAFPVTDGMSGTGSNDWTAGWTNWDPENTNYGSPTTTVSADITSNTTWTTGTIVSLQNKVFVKNGAVLTIQPGVIIRGDKATQGALIITRGSKIIAAGTQANPIIFSSGEAPGNRAEGDWGGIILLGQAVNNQPGGVANIEGLASSADTEYGGSNDQDSSGVLSYVRIEFPGIAFQPNKEINGLTFGSVGSKTQVDHIQVSFSGDDSFEWFGGTVDAKYLVAFRGLDDDFDTDFGFRGRVQFVLAIRDLDLFDAAGDSNCFESDNDGTGSNAQPLTAPVFSNITIIGPKRDGTVSLPIGEKFEKSFRLRRNTALSIFNSISTGWEKGLSIEGAAAEDNFNGDTAVFAHNYLVNFSAGANVVTASSAFYSGFFGADMNDSLQTLAGVNWVNPFPANLNATPDYRLQSSSVIATGADFSNPKFTGGVIGSGEISAVVTGLQLFPNPSHGKSWIRISTKMSIDFSLVIFDISGKVCGQMAEEMLSAGEHLVELPTSGLAQGIYFVKTEAGDQRQILKLVVSH